MGVLSSPIQPFIHGNLLWSLPSVKRADYWGEGPLYPHTNSNPLLLIHHSHFFIQDMHIVFPLHNCKGWVELTSAVSVGWLDDEACNKDEANH